MLAIGIQSGTSADGIDVALVRDPLTWPKIVSARTVPYRAKTREMILRAPRQGGAEEVALLDRTIGDEFAAAVNTLPKAKVIVVGSHGQTIYHLPRVSSLQLGSPAIIAARTGLPVAADFRSSDIAAGGEGAPLVPLLDRMLFRQVGRIAALNLGGIANVTIVADGEIEIAYDIGPANAMIDAAMRLRFGTSHDKNAARARRGKINERVVARILAHPYFRRKPPKTTGPEEFGAEFVASLPRMKNDDLVATVTAASARAIARELARLEPDEVYVSGGGIRNPLLMAPLPGAHLLPQGDFKEAMLFAVLGAMRLKEIPADLRRVTGAKNPVILGGLWLPR